MRIEDLGRMKVALKTGESLTVGDALITVTRCGEGRVEVAVVAPRDTLVLRGVSSGTRVHEARETASGSSRPKFRTARGFGGHHVA